MKNQVQIYMNFSTLNFLPLVKNFLCKITHLSPSECIFWSTLDLTNESSTLFHYRVLYQFKVGHQSKISAVLFTDNTKKCNVNRYDGKIVAISEFSLLKFIRVFLIFKKFDEGAVDFAAV